VRVPCQQAPACTWSGKIRKYSLPFSYPAQAAGKSCQCVVLTLCKVVTAHGIHERPQTSTRAVPEAWPSHAEIFRCMPCPERRAKTFTT
jgi:hypothetical protein